MIEEWLSRGESETVEFKRSLGEKKEILETVVAFANKNGGTILVGVDDDGTAVGVHIGKGTIESLVNDICQSIEPSIIPSVEVVEFKGKNIIVIKVPKGYDAPYFFRGRAYIRVGKTNRVMTSAEIEHLVSVKVLEKVHLDSRPTNSTIDEVDENVVRWFVEQAKFARNINIEFVSIEDFVEKLGVVVNGRLTLAGVLCFSRNPQKHIPYAIIRAGRFRNGLTPIDDQTMEGNVFEQISDALKFIKKHINITYRVREDGLREEIWEYPLWSLREAIVNAVTHRDYGVSSPIYIRIYDDRVEIESPGRLPEPLTVENLKGPHTSILRNPQIGKIMFMTGFIEAWGTGTNKMIEECLKHGLPEPEFVETKITFKVILGKKHKLNQTLKRLLGFIKEKGEITRKEYQEYAGISERTARKHIEILKNLGYIEVIRKGKQIYYRLKRQDTYTS
ncbi:MAG: RNA-binding domain-containing protein [Candidatus Njordarchaeota archaeon]